MGNNMAKILVVEDETDLAVCLQSALAKEQHIVEIIDNGDEAVRHLSTYGFDLIILDWMLPGMSGIDVCKRYRKNGGDAQVMMLTARSHVDDRAEGLDAGADDYLGKPFHMKEFLARVRAMLRRSNHAHSHLLKLGDIVVDTEASHFEYNDKKSKLLRKELDILVFLLKYPGRSFTGEELLNRVWGADSIVTTETVRIHIKNIRKKAELIGYANVIEHTRGLGYGVGIGACSQTSDGDSVSSSCCQRA